MKVQFETHEGSLDTDSGHVTFYQMEFVSICYAIPFLKVVTPGDTFNQWYYRGFKGVMNTQNLVYVCGIWFVNDDDAEYYIRKTYGDGRP
jgi:hypothetical protein